MFKIGALDFNLIAVVVALGMIIIFIIVWIISILIENRRQKRYIKNVSLIVENEFAGKNEFVIGRKGKQYYIQPNVKVIMFFDSELNILQIVDFFKISKMLVDYNKDSITITPMYYNDSPSFEFKGDKDFKFKLEFIKFMSKKDFKKKLEPVKK